jgi:putative tryptophan/tyrosine transport system substrate-binding protein
LTARAPVHVRGPLLTRPDFLSGVLLLGLLRFAEAQPRTEAHRIAIVHPVHPVEVFSKTGWYRALLEELQRLGYFEGRNLTVERYSGGGRTEHYAELARQIVRSKPSLIFAISVRMTRHFKEATTTIPIVGSMASPVEAGLVTSLARPGGNITGISVDAGIELLAKRLELLLEVVPGATRVAFLAPRAAWSGADGLEMQRVAQRQGVVLVGPPLEDPIQQPEFRRVFGIMTQERVDAVIVGDHPENTGNAQLIVDLAKASGLPAIYAYREYLEFGGLMTYGVDLARTYRRIAPYIDQILKGANPGDIPINQAERFELAINLKMAKTMGLTFPPSLIARADEIFE